MGVRVQRHTPAALPPAKRPSTHCTGGCLGPSDGLDWGGKSLLYGDSIPGPSRAYQYGLALKRCMPRGL